MVERRHGLAPTASGSERSSTMTSITARDETKSSVKMSQKEYLRKYLTASKEERARKKKKRRKQKIGAKTVRIIDDDDDDDADVGRRASASDLKNTRPIQEGEFEIFNNTEDAPRIVGVIDERGPVDFADKRRWKIIADDGYGNVACSLRDDASSGQNSPGDLADRPGATKPVAETRSSLGGASKRKKFGSSSKMVEKRAEQESDSSVSSERIVRGNESAGESRAVRNRLARSSAVSEDSDLSPPRVTREAQSRDTRGKRASSRHENSDSDQSPPRRRRKTRDERRTREHSDSDLDLPRRRERDDENAVGKEGVSSKASPRFDSKESTAKRWKKIRGEGKCDVDPRNDSGRRKERASTRRMSRWNDRAAEGSTSPRTPEQRARMTKTLDGKTAGLQDAKALRVETAAHKKREAELFKEMSAEASGAGRSAVLRDRRTGKRRDLAAEAAERREKEKRQEEIDEKYAKWGRGLKQVDDRAEKRQRDLHEMSKPLARYANDADLDREQRREMHIGDPMLDYMKKKYTNEGKCEAERPSYRGSYLPNRFGIKPGYRWDGVDRSNGYEKKWFDARNARTALAEEAYKWSTADM